MILSCPESKKKGRTRFDLKKKNPTFFVKCVISEKVS